MPEPPRLRFGVVPADGGVRCCLWAPSARRAEVVPEDAGRPVEMRPRGDGTFEAHVAGLRHGALYRYRLDGALYPDPASRFQPHGVHGPSMVVDPRRYAWRDGEWTGLPPERWVFYELHVGTFTRRGTFAAARDRLGYLRDLGITAVELMPVADFPGRWNWGYDPSALFAPSRAYGTPDDLRGFVDEAHRLGVGVFLDVVYNHFGPDGAYAVAISPRFLSAGHRTPWGPAVNLDGPDAALVRAFFIDNALHWLAEYHLDGLRLDATHALIDHGPVHFLADLAAAVRRLPGRSRFLIAEDNRNLDRLVRAPERGGYGLDGVWSDDYHHQMRRILTGQDDGYFADFTTSTEDLATIIRRGWLFAGQHSKYFGGPRGTDPTGIPLSRFVHFLQNHDQVGNRPFGDRLTDRIPLHVYRAASALLLFAPEAPAVFMGQEWAASTPFLYFTDHAGALGQAVSADRREELRSFRGFECGIPDPQDPQTYRHSVLRWAEAAGEPHAGILRLYRDLLARRRDLDGACHVESPVPGGIALSRGRRTLLAALRDDLVLPLAREARPVWHSEEPQYAPDPIPPRRDGAMMRFPRAAALIAELPP